MCLDNSVAAVNDFLKKNKKRKVIKAFKVVSLASEYRKNAYWGFVATGKKVLKPPFMSGKPYRGGEYKSNSDAKGVCTKNKPLYRGIHVCLTKERAAYLSGYQYGYKVLEVTARIEDLIGVNCNQSEAVFKKIYVPKKEVKKALS